MFQLPEGMLWFISSHHTVAEMPEAKHEMNV